MLCMCVTQGQLLISLLADRKDDDEFVLQIIVTLQTLLDFFVHMRRNFGQFRGMFRVLPLFLHVGQQKNH